MHNLDRNPPPTDSERKPRHGTITYHQCNITSWPSLLGIFTKIGHLDIVIANAGVSQECDYFADTFSADGELKEPAYDVLDVNLRAMLNVVKLTLRAFRSQWGGRQDGGGSLVLTSSATAYAPELSLPVYSASKLAVSSLLPLLLLPPPPHLSDWVVC